jgi:arginine/lysine/ornithine decarboxylase
MMEPPGGTALVEESIVESLEFRRAMRKVDDEFGDSWWFKVRGPDVLADNGVGWSSPVGFALGRVLAWFLAELIEWLQHARSHQGKQSSHLVLISPAA